MLSNFIQLLHYLQSNDRKAQGDSEGYSVVYYMEKKECSGLKIYPQPTNESNESLNGYIPIYDHTT